jgi:hypothetical protein
LQRFAQLVYEAATLWFSAYLAEFSFHGVQWRTEP